MKIHFISIGGSVMHQLAIALKRKGYTITGSDDEIFEPSASNLKKEGLFPTSFGWDEANVHAGLDAIILGMHARADNPELIKAQSLNLPIYSFPEYIYQESKEKKRVVIGGSHGKTTTTSMIMHVLRETGQSFDYLVGARLEGFEQSVQVTDAPVVVCEGDEYPASALNRVPKFHFLYPHIAVLTGIAWDHINVFPTFDNYLEQFRIFIARIEKGGTLIYNETDKVLSDLVKESNRKDLKLLPYGIPEHGIEFGLTRVILGGSEADLMVFGNHNLLNMHAAWLVCESLGINAKDFTKAISHFTGAAKRLEVLAKNEDTIFFRDFAHAPSKVKATLDAVRTQFPDRRIITALELHTYSSLNEAFMKEYEGSLAGADEAVVFYSSHALQIKKLPHLPEDVVLNGFKKEGLKIITDKATLEAWLEEQELQNAVVLFMSSGNYEGLDTEAFAKEMVNTPD